MGGAAIYDHLIFAELEEEKERRWQITINNAEAFLQGYRAGRFRFTPVGVAQGWDPPSYQRAARELMRIGYDHIAIGGLVRSQTSEVVAVLTAIKKELQPDTQVHLFGVNRPEEITTFAQLGVTSFDSASRLRRAWMDGRRNYFLGHNAYTAIRVPDMRTLDTSELNEVGAKRLEQAALQALRAYHAGTLGLEPTFAAVQAYATLTGKFTDRWHCAATAPTCNDTFFTAVATRTAKPMSIEQAAQAITDLVRG
ncbi:MAG: tRNA-guanine transglycosylase DpdA [Oscillochloridaceae bacterium umkhey_bin13]